MSKILVTGSSGVVGTALIAELREHGYDVVAVTSADVDLRDFDATRIYFDKVAPDAVVHLAATVCGLMGHMRRHGAVYLDNILLNTHVVEASREAGVAKFVAMGSAAVYSDLVPLPMSETGVWLGTPHWSEFGYAHAKRAMLAQLEAYRDQYGLEYAFALSTNVYGPNDKFDEQYGHVIPSLVSKFYRAATTGEAPTVWGTGQATRDFLYSRDAARGLRLMLEQATGPINLATGTSMPIREAVDTLQVVSGFAGTVNWDATKPDGQVVREYDTHKLTELGWSPTLSLAEGLAETYEWYATHFPNVRK
jgi:GDP-L-fucose synthase